MRERIYRFPKRSSITITVLVVILVTIYFGGRAFYNRNKSQKTAALVTAASIIGTSGDSPIGGPDKAIPASATARIDGLIVYTIDGKQISSSVNFDTLKQPDDQNTACDGYPHSVIDQTTDEYRAYLCYFYLRPSDTCFSTEAKTDPHPCPDRSSVGMKNIKVHYVTRKADDTSGISKTGTQLILAINIPNSSGKPSKWWATDLVDTNSSLYEMISATRSEATIEQGILYPVLDTTRVCPAQESCVASSHAEKYLKTKSGTIYHILNYEDSELLGVAG